MLGRGLESLIPPQDGNNPQNTRGSNIIPAEPHQIIPREEHPLASPSAPIMREEVIPTRPIPSPVVKAIEGEHIFHLEAEKIKPNPHQPRREFNEEALKDLASSIREFGILQPLVVSKIEKETDRGTEVEYQLIAGERRWRAAKLLGLERVPAIVRSIMKDTEKLELAIVENLQRENLNAIETARAYAKLQDEFGLTQREVAARLGKSRETIANTLRLLSLPSEIQDAVAKNKINESQARLLLTIEEVATQMALFHELINNSLSVRELRMRIGRVPRKDAGENKRREANEDPEVQHIEERLMEVLGAKVTVQKHGEAGKVIIQFHSPEELEGIIEKIKPNER